MADILNCFTMATEAAGTHGAGADGSGAASAIGGNDTDPSVLVHEFTGDGNLVGIARYGKSYDDSAVFKQQAGLHFLLYDPHGPVGLQNDVAGIAGNWVQATDEGARDEYDVEAFYRFALFGGLDTTVAYQYAINPALTREIDHAHVLSLRFRAVF